MNTLQKTLLTNAIFSGVSGITLIIFHMGIAKHFGIENGQIFWIIGIGLLLFAASIVYEIRRQKATGVLAIIFQDFLWVIGSVLLLVLQPFDLSKVGNITILVVALMVLFLGIGQAKALAQADSTGKSGIKQLSFERIMHGSKSEVWKLVSDVANYDKVAPGLDDVTIISGEGLGMVRRCSHGNDQWTETCSVWNEEQEYAFEVNTSAPDYPHPFKYLKGHWLVETIDEDHTRVTMTFEFEYLKKRQNWMLHPFLKGRFSKDAEALLDNWEAELEQLK